MQLGPDKRSQVKYHFARYTRGNVLDVGHGADKAYPHFAAVRLATDEECEQRKIREIVTESLGLLPEVEDGKCDAIVAADCFHLLGEVSFGAAVTSWLRCIVDGGHLCIYEPDGEKVLVGDFVRAVETASEFYGVDVLRFEGWPAGGSFVILRKLGIEHAGILCKSYEENPPAKGRACVVRHGGIGDQLQAAYLLPGLKRAGFHVTMLTTPKGAEPIERDPNIDEWFMVDKGQVPVGELPWFWNVIANDYERFVNLNESVEGTFLAIPGRVQHTWPKALRDRLLGGNYAEHAAAIAQIPFVAEGQFYPDDAEVIRAETFLREIKDNMNKGLVIGQRSHPAYVVMWVLSGSSPHKFTPHQDVIVRELLARLKRAAIIFVGDDACRMLEAGWESEPRVYCRSGELSLRDTLALAQRVDCVVGPETGVLNAVCYEPNVKKVLMLSHSSPENLSKHWLNTTAIEGRSQCYPCHQLHYTAEFCPLDPESGAAMCQRSVAPETIYAAIDADYVGWVKVQSLRSAA
jgi:ADP-heptose:LPS heptosyltransferase